MKFLCKFGGWRQVVPFTFTTMMLSLCEYPLGGSTYAYLGIVRSHVEFCRPDHRCHRCRRFRRRPERTHPSARAGARARAILAMRNETTMGDESSEVTRRRSRRVLRARGGPRARRAPVRRQLRLRAHTHIPRSADSLVGAPEALGGGGASHARARRSTARERVTRDARPSSSPRVVSPRTGVRIRRPRAETSRRRRGFIFPRR